MIYKSINEIADVTKLAGFEFTKHIKYIENGEIIALRALNLRDGHLDLKDIKRIDKSVSEQLTRSKLYKNDIVVSYTGTIGECAQIHENDKYHLAPNVAKIAPNPIFVNPQYLFHYIRSSMFRNQMYNYCHGSTQPTIPMKTIRELSIPIFPLETQKQIASILSALDDKIELNNRINENLEQQIQAILLNMIQQDSEKDSIETVKLGEYLYIKGRIGWKGLKKDEYLDSSDYRIINGESLTKDGIDWNKAGFISKERYDESPEIMLQVGDILLSKDGTIGKIGYVDNLDSPSTVASGIFVIRNIKPDIISTQFIYYLLKSKLFSAFIASRTEGSVIPHLYQKDFMEFAFPLPNADEMSQFDALTSPLFATIIKNLRENEFLTATRDALLPKLMNGEIDVSAVRI